MRTAGDLAIMIKQEIAMDLAELGDNEQRQNDYIYQFMSLALQEWARIAYQVEVSDPLTISGDGYVSFQKSAQPITDLYEPLRILKSDGYPERQRTNFAGGIGWYKESANADIHCKEMFGDYVLHYIRYPHWITQDSDIPEFPPAGYLALIYKVCGLIKESKNFYEESAAMYAKADKHLAAVVMANLSAQGSTDGKKPSYNDYGIVRGG